MEKILISVIVDLFKDDGTTVRPKRVAETLKNDYDVTIITRSNEKEVYGPDMNIKVIKPFGTKLWNFKLIPFITRNKYDFIYCSNDFFGFLTYYLMSKFYNYKIIFEAHSILSEELKERKINKLKVGFYKILEKFVVKNSDLVVALSENTLNFYKKYNKNIELVSNFVDEELFKIREEKINNLNIKHVGLIGPFKNFGNQYFLDFLYQNIKKFDDKIKFILIGNCDRRIESDKIIYTGYIKDNSEYIKILSSLDAVLVPSKIATFGPLTKILEPLACFVPVFTTPKGVVGLHNYENGKNILIFKEEDLVEGVNRCIFDKDLMEKVGKEGRAYFKKYYSKKANENKLLSIFKRLSHD